MLVPRLTRPQANSKNQLPGKVRRSSTNRNSAKSVLGTSHKSPPPKGAVPRPNRNCAASAAGPSVPGAPHSAYSARLASPHAAYMPSSTLARRSAHGPTSKLPCGANSPAEK